MNIVPTELNESLAKAIRHRIAAQGTLIYGKVGFWHLLAFGLIIFGIGAAAGLGFYGYSQIIQKKDDLTILSSMLSEALSKVQLRASAGGTVQLEPHDLSLAKGQTVSLSADSHVLLDRSSTVVANGDITVQLPSISVPPNVMPRAAGKMPLVTNFTVFKAVAFGKGSVMTGWSFLTSAQATPTYQYCYYTANLETRGFDINVALGRDGKLETAKTLPTGFDVNAAFDRCVWFKNVSQ